MDEQQGACVPLFQNFFYWSYVADHKAATSQMTMAEETLVEVQIL